MEIGILGPLAVRSDDGQPLTVSGARVRAMLALTALEPGVPMAAERLVDGLWGAEPPASTDNTLATLAKRLRASLGAADVIQARPPGYLLLVEPDAVDGSRRRRAGLQRSSWSSSSPALLVCCRGHELTFADADDKTVAARWQLTPGAAIGRGELS